MSGGKVLGINVLHGQKKDKESTTASADAGDMSQALQVPKSQSDDGDHSSSSDVVEIIDYFSSGSGSDSDSEGEEKRRGREVGQAGNISVHTSSRDSITIALAIITQAESKFLAGFSHNAKGFTLQPKSQAYAAVTEALRVLRLLHRVQVRVEEVRREVMNVVNRRGIREVDDSLESLFRSQQWCDDKRHDGAPAIGCGRESLGAEDERATLSEGDYDGKAYDRAYVKKLLEEQLEQLRSDVVAIGISLGQDEVAGIIRSREGELAELSACAERDERLVNGR